MNELATQVKVLIVDDQPLIVEELGEFLTNHGYICICCQSSRDAIDQFRDDPDISLVLCDLHMPDYDGIELVRALKLIAGKDRLFEAIMLTGRADKQDVIKALREGFADYYQKPVDLNELLEGLQRQELSLHEQQKSLQQLGHLNQKLQYLAESIDHLYQDLDKVRQRPPLAPPADGPDEPEGDEMPAIIQHLSPRQLDVARLVGKGQTNYQIACELGITENTVKLYVSQVLRLTHMHNRTQLALALSPSGSGLRQRATAH
ncbi:response regulator transcription factor [Pseudomonas sp. R5(2019)]|uniref:response regulator n=1 Tax=Pseudomonas sp. R5(2019) TaxID=2697566 RepID=UPI0014136F3E|nr:response regulator [Pseudomonas sp. R5(2019)]